MDHNYLARYDGSEQAAGRGAGATAQDDPTMPPPTPYMQMTYFPIERRLDTAIFRSLFASSVRQARQFVVHGLVKVNGKKVGPMVPLCHDFVPGSRDKVQSTRANTTAADAVPWILAQSWRHVPSRALFRHVRDRCPYGPFLDRP